MSFPSRHLFLLLCAGALVLAGGAVVAADGTDRPPVLSDSAESSPVMIDVGNSTNYLSTDLRNVTRTEYQPASLDVSAAVESDALRLKGQHQRQAHEERLADSTDETAIARSTVRTIERDVAQLEQQQAELYRSYSGGEIDTATLFRELVRLGVTGEQYREFATAVQDQVTLPDEVTTRYNNLDGELSLLPSPFVSHIESELSTNGESPLYVQSGSDSMVMATAEGGTYLRHAVLFGERDRNLTDQFGTGDRTAREDAFNRAQQLYPWTFTRADSIESRTLGNTSVYRIHANHPHGEIETYLDGATTNPFYEVQKKTPEAVPVTDFQQTVNDSLRMDVQLTDPTGPMEVEIIEVGDIEYESITVSIDGETVKTLSEGDSFTTIQPSGDFEISAETDTGREVSRLITQS